MNHEPPMEGKPGQPTTGSSAPGANQASSNTGRAPVAGPSTHREKDPEVAQEMRPVATSGPRPLEVIVGFDGTSCSEELVMIRVDAAGARAIAGAWALYHSGPTAPPRDRWFDDIVKLLHAAAQIDQPEPALVPVAWPELIATWRDGFGLGSGS